MAKQELRQARQQGFPAEAIQSLAHQFLSLVRSHSRLKRSSNARQKTRDVRTAREQCHTNFGRYAKEVLDGGPSSHVTPAFGEEINFSQRYTILAFGTMSSRYGCLHPQHLVWK